MALALHCSVHKATNGDETNVKTKQALDRINAVLRDPVVRYSVKNALRLALERDPNDAADDAALVSELLTAYAIAILEDAQ